MNLFSGLNKKNSIRFLLYILKTTTMASTKSGAIRIYVPLCIGCWLNARCMFTNFYFLFDKTTQTITDFIRNAMHQHFEIFIFQPNQSEEKKKIIEWNIISPSTSFDTITKSFLLFGFIDIKSQTFISNH